VIGECFSFDQFKNFLEIDLAANRSRFPLSRRFITPELDGQR
jgi:hypothetical protein